MNEKFENAAVDADSLELGLQELEVMEAPGWWTTGGVVVGVSLVSVVLT
ncbi:daptide-type RiPP [Streptomyces sp. NPDC048825]